jgi:hypothetical protein
MATFGTVTCPSLVFCYIMPSSILGLDQSSFHWQGPTWVTALLNLQITPTKYRLFSLFITLIPALLKDKAVKSIKP